MEEYLSNSLFQCGVFPKSSQCFRTKSSAKMKSIEVSGASCHINSGRNKVHEQGWLSV